MQVSISKAAEMVGVTRATLYRHIDKKGIEVKKDQQNNPKIDVAELERVYGIDLYEVNDNAHAAAPREVFVEQAPLRERVKSPVSMMQRAQAASQNSRRDEGDLARRFEQLEKENTAMMQERQRERTQLLRQIDGLQASLRHEQENQRHLIEMLDKQKAYVDKYATQIPEEWDVMTKTVAKIRNQHKRILLEFHEQKRRGFWARLFNK